MSDRTVIDGLLSQWQRHRAEGRDVAVEHLCHDRPDLQEQVAAEVAVLRLMGTDGTGTSPTGPHGLTTIPQDGPPAAPPAPVPDYEILGTLGQGGMGVVYKARQHRLNRVVALKMILAGPRTGAAELRRFLVEAEAVAAVKHPHVVQVYESGEYGGRPFLAMEYLPGGSLADRLARDGRPEPGAAAVLVGAIAAGVQAAHDQGIVHRDLKPGNILFDAAGVAKVTDFGLAKRGAGSDLTATDAVMGTPAYMSPEQAKGETKFVGPQADVWALGVILYECLTGARPFAAPDAIALIRKVMDEDPERPRTRIAGLPRDVELICLKCLAKDPAERYATAGALAADLGRFAAGEPVSVRAAGKVERAYKWAKRNPTRAAAYGLTLAVLVLAAFGTSFAVLWRSAERARDAADGSRAEAESARDQLADQNAIVEDARQAAVDARGVADASRREAETARDRLAGVEYGRTMQLASQDYRENDLSATLIRLRRTRPELRGWEWHHVSRLLHSQLTTFVGHTGSLYSAAYSPDGSRVVTASMDKTARIWDAATGAEQTVLKGHSKDVLSAAYSPDGTQVVTGSMDRTARIWDAKTGDELRALKGHTEAVAKAAFSPDGTRIVTAGVDNVARVWDASTGAELIVLRGHTDMIASAAFSPDGTRIVTAGFDDVARVWDARTGAEQLVLQGHTIFVASANFSPDGARIVTGSHDKTAKVWDARTGADLLTFRGHTSALRSASFSPDGARMVTASADKTVRVWDARTGAETLVLRGHTEEVLTASFSVDGTRILTASFDKSAQVWDARTGPEDISFWGHTTSIASAGFSPDGARLVTGSGDGLAKVWDARTGVEQLALRGHTSVVRSASFSPDGARVLTASTDNTVRVWAAGTGATLVTLRGHTGGVRSARFSTDGTRIVTAGMDGVAKVWDAGTGAELAVLKGHARGVVSASFSPDGSQVVTGSMDATARIWDGGTGAEVRTLAGHQMGVLSASFSPDGSRVVTTSMDFTARVWDARTGAEVFPLDGHTNMVMSAAFDPDGGRIVTGSTDATAKIWDARTGAEVLTLKGHGNGVMSASFSPDGTRVVTAGADGVTKVWDGRPEREVARLRCPVQPTEAIITPDGGRLIARVGVGEEYSVNLPPGGPADRYEVQVDDRLVRVLTRPEAKWGPDPWTDARLRLTAADWHARTARSAEKREDWYAAGFHHGRLAALTPWDGAAHRDAARSWHKAGQPRQAAVHAVAAALVGVGW